MLTKIICFLASVPFNLTKIKKFLLHLQPVNLQEFYSCYGLVCHTKYKCHCSCTPLCSPVPFWKGEGGRWSIIITSLTQWLRWWVLSSAFELNSIKPNGNSIVIASRFWIRNLKSQPTPPVQFCLSLGEKSPWYQCRASALLCTGSWYCRTTELAGAKPLIVHLVCSQQNWQLNSDDEVFTDRENTRNSKLDSQFSDPRHALQQLPKKISILKDHQYWKINICTEKNCPEIMYLDILWIPQRPHPNLLHTRFLQIFWTFRQ